VTLLIDIEHVLSVEALLELFVLRVEHSNLRFDGLVQLIQLSVD
jgi:hypothetical protein